MLQNVLEQCKTIVAHVVFLIRRLYQQYKKELVIIAFPSNTFNHENKTDAEIAQFCKTTYNTHFILAQKTPVKGEGVHPVFNWLSKKSENSMMDSQVWGDFQKFLVNEEGLLIGEFSPKLSPLSREIQDAITAK